MCEVKITSQFKKDYKLVKKRGYDLNLLKEVIDMIINSIELPEQYKDHTLVGNYTGFRECHIKADWLLVYLIENDSLALTRTGTHSDLF